VDRSFFKNLDTKRLLLRNISPEDAEFFYQVFSNARVCEYLFDEEPIQSVDEAMKWIGIYNNDAIYHNRWVIINKTNGLRLGTCGFHNWNYQYNRVEIGYDLLPEYWGKGYMNEALTKAIEFAFSEMKINRIAAHIYPENIRSINVVEKLGFKREGLLRDYYFSRGKYYDHFMYSLLKNENR
jgi:ribosomal-protein-alanine N-acetyltransferase